MRGEILWTPPPDVNARSRVGQFLAWLERERHAIFADYQVLQRWSVDDLDAFWGSLVDWFGVGWNHRPSCVLRSRAMPGAEWFPDGTLNYAEHALTLAGVRSDDLAIIARSQSRPERRLTWGELREQVARCRVGLQALGVDRGDRVAAYLPNIPETVVAFLAAASLGATWASCAPEFGVKSVVDRLAQIEPKVLLAIDGYRYGNKIVDRAAEVEAIVAALPSIEHVVHVPYAVEAPGVWGELLAHDAPLAFDAVPFTHPLYVLFSSGTTGLPKPIIHGHGGITVEHLKTLGLHHDLGVGDRFFWFTTTGWMMWNYLVSGLLVGATIVLFDGDPGYPNLSTLWTLAADADVRVFGVSAPFIMAGRKAGVRPPRSPVLASVGSTGAPLPADGFRWVHDMLGADVQPASVSGGTDVCTAFVGAVPLLPVRAGEISCRMLGCAVAAFDDDGTPCPPGVQGELVVTAAMPSMPVGFWGDDDGSKLRSAYYSDYPGVWRHGDWITFTDDGACVISGRSDATLNRGGVRLGTSDFYAVVEELPEIADSLVVHLEGEADDAMGELILFVVLAPGVAFDDGLQTRIRSALRDELSPRHVPDAIYAVPSVPRTLSGKKLEVPVKRILRGASADTVASRASLADPDSLDWFEAFASPK